MFWTFEKAWLQAKINPVDPEDLEYGHGSKADPLAVKILNNNAPANTNTQIPGSQQFPDLTRRGQELG